MKVCVCTSREHLGKNGQAQGNKSPRSAKVPSDGERDLLSLDIITMENNKTDNKSRPKLRKGRDSC